MTLAEHAAAETEADRVWLAQHLRTETRFLNMPRGHVRVLVETIKHAAAHDLQLFFLLCVQYRPSRNRFHRRGSPLMTWWAPGDNGYAQSLLWAGRYTAQRLADQQDYYRLWPHKDARTMALPVAVVMDIAVPKPDPGDRRFWSDGPGPLLPNHQMVWDMLETHAFGQEDMFELALKEAQRIDAASPPAAV